MVWNSLFTFIFVLVIYHTWRESTSQLTIVLLFGISGRGHMTILEGERTRQQLSQVLLKTTILTNVGFWPTILTEGASSEPHKAFPRAAMLLWSTMCFTLRPKALVEVHNSSCLQLHTVCSDECRDFSRKDSRDHEEPIRVRWFLALIPQTYHSIIH